MRRYKNALHLCLRIFARFCSFVTATSLLVGAIGALLGFLLLFSFAYCQFSSITNQKPPGVPRWVTERALHLLGFPVSDENYGALVNAATNAGMVLIALWTAAFSLFAIWRHRRRSLRQRSLQPFRVHDADDELEVMRKHYKGCDKIIAFAGDFSWIKNDPHFQKELKAMGDKVRFVSSKNRDAVAGALGDALMQDFASRFSFDSGIDVKCSILWRAGTMTFLYRAQVSDNEHHFHTVVCALHDTGESKYLVEVIAKFCMNAACRG